MKGVVRDEKLKEDLAFIECNAMSNPRTKRTWEKLIPYLKLFPTLARTILNKQSLVPHCCCNSTITISLGCLL